MNVSDVEQWLAEQAIECPVLNGRFAPNVCIRTQAQLRRDVEVDMRRADTPALLAEAKRRVRVCRACPRWDPSARWDPWASIRTDRADNPPG